MKLSIIKAIGLASLVFSLSSCVTKGENFSSKTSWINTDQTSMQDVRSVLGTPFAVGSSSGTPTWTYGFYKYRLIGKSHTKELKFYFTGEGRVKNYSFTSSFPEDKRSAGFHIESKKLGK
jgi:outer membrane protein assembly factor BamE (lipoprotein component of BamABCDE complex)